MNRIACADPSGPLPRPKPGPKTILKGKRPPADLGGPPHSYRRGAYVRVAPEAQAHAMQPALGPGANPQNPQTPPKDSVKVVKDYLLQGKAHLEK